VSRPIFHVPTRSNYVFLAELAILRGSDASNVHDEEPAEYELEFSDDEAEAVHKAKLRQRSVSFSFAWQSFDCLVRTGGMARAIRASLRRRPMCATKMWMPRTAGTRMQSTACTIWTWIMARARRALHPSLTTTLTRMLTTSQNLAQVQRRPLLPYRQDRSVGPMDVREAMTTDAGKAVMAHGCITIVNACGPAGVAAVEVGVGAGAVAGCMDKKGIRHMERKTMVPPVADHYHLPRRVLRKQ
jgi:hypothetical protein